ncbi:hypothetical protein FCM35_KLT22392 [Carex littledalei]|uniref:Uncharacterized protein n=1 Tax=Carex littledalei TaxID=544730 RepID=A0A833VDN1_9POAL|nr:hypothetical protein FCM35_KLT22392 [Carex littledalei]
MHGLLKPPSHAPASAHELPQDGILGNTGYSQDVDGSSHPNQDGSFQALLSSHNGQEIAGNDAAMTDWWGNQPSVHAKNVNHILANCQVGPTFPCLVNSQVGPLFSCLANSQAGPAFPCLANSQAGPAFPCLANSQAGPSCVSLANRQVGPTCVSLANRQVGPTLPGLANSSGGTHVPSLANNQMGPTLSTLANTTNGTNSESICMRGCCKRKRMQQVRKKY